MQPHPDFAEIDLPRSSIVGPYKLTPLTIAETEEDYAVVMDSAEVVTEIFDDWPAGLTLELNRTDLAWHDNEFVLKRSFSWIIRDAQDAYLGCFYIFPEPGGRGTAEAVVWLRKMDGRSELAAELFPLIENWATAHVPPTVVLSWSRSPAL